MDSKSQTVLKMETAALALGIISVVGCTCLYFSIPAGALAILFANLSRGIRTNYTSRQKLALTLGIAGIALTICFYAYAVYVAFSTFGNLQGILEAYSKYSGISYDELQQLIPFAQ